MRKRMVLVVLSCVTVLFVFTSAGASAMVEWCAGGCPPPINLGFRSFPSAYDDGKAFGLHYENVTAIARSAHGINQAIEREEEHEDHHDEERHDEKD